MADQVIQMKNGSDNVFPEIESKVVTQEKEIQFNSGAGFVSLSATHDLVSAVTINRPSSEVGNYAITNIYGRDDAYRLQNASPNLTAKVKVLLTWVRKV